MKLKKTALCPVTPPPPSRSPPVSPSEESSTSGEDDYDTSSEDKRYPPRTRRAVVSKRPNKNGIKEIIESFTGSSSSSSATPATAANKRKHKSMPTMDDNTIRKRPRMEIFMSAIINAPGATVSSPSTQEVTPIKSTMELMIDRERYANYQVRPNYPDICGVLEPGDRRHLVNIIMGASDKMRSEPGTPTFAALTMDRYLSAITTSVTPKSSPILALSCLNIAGKLVDLDPDSTRYGTVAMTKFIRDCSETSKSVREFRGLIESLERKIVNTIGMEMYAIPSVLEYIEEGTKWSTNSQKWNLAVTICDIFYTFTDCTKYTQHQIACAIVYIIEYPMRDSVAMTGMMVPIVNNVIEVAGIITRDVTIYLNSPIPELTKIATDPFAGVRLKYGKVLYNTAFGSVLKTILSINK